MMPHSKDDESYDFDADAEQTPPADESPKPALGRGIPRPSEVELIRIEDDEPPRPKASVRDLDVCPSCGGTMRGADNLVCVRCGFDLKTMKKVATVTGAVEVDDAAQEPNGELIPIIKPGNGEYWLPVILAAISGVVLLIGYFAGAPALFPRIEQATPENQAVVVNFWSRVVGVLQTLVTVGMIKLCGLGALTFVAYLNTMRLAKGWDDLKLGGVRMGAIAVAMQLATFINLPQRSLEWLAEVILQLGIFAGLSIALFRLPHRDAPILTGAMAMLFVIVWLFAFVIVWATGGSV